MCGIAGFIDFSNKLDQQHLVQMRDALAHRGPDDKGDLLVRAPTATVGLGHRRLSIIDLSPLGHQPMSAQGYHIVFNGEIYNFQEIRKPLVELGHQFTSHCDTEVILRAFIEWGPKAVDRFIGMFAFAIYDENQNRVYLFRDRAGVKPLYYFWDGSCMLFASELKSFHAVPAFSKKLNIAAVRMFLNYGYVPTPHAIFQNTFKLKPGSYITLGLQDRKLDEEVYWNVLDYYEKPKLDISFDEAMGEVDKLLTSAFNYRMVADVPVGVFLSGGYDSSILAAILQKHSTQRIKTFTIGFHESSFNEAHHAKAIANHLGTEHTEQYCSSKDAIELLRQLPHIYDEPFGDSSGIPTTLVSKVAVRDVKVALSADAGDEIFAGYDKYKVFLEYFRKFSRIPTPAARVFASTLKTTGPLWQRLFKRAYNIDTRIYKISQILQDQKDINSVFKALNQIYGEMELDDLIAADQSYSEQLTFFDERLDHEESDLHKMLATDYKTYLLDDILTKVDRATMSVSLEGREPFLDHRIIEFVAQLPGHYKYRDGTGKYLLKQLAHTYIPQELLDRPKMGFGVPVEMWLKDALRPLVEQYLDTTRIRRNGLFNPDKIETLRTAFFGGQKFNVTKLWFLLMFEMWYERWME
ncbi:MAG TPA: asparagine synthase (glutamine-hydrolyzing) [Cyclobacteriaceae bacterium]|nr:asparagine synthase (glutamine-hydrolyzing) [Cyclobacteriaceae bacterium]